MKKPPAKSHAKSHAKDAAMPQGKMPMAAMVDKKPPMKGMIKHSGDFGSRKPNAEMKKGD